MDENAKTQTKAFLPALKAIFAAVLAVFAYIVVLALAGVVFAFVIGVTHAGSSAEEMTKAVGAHTAAANAVGNVAAAGILCAVIALMKKRIPDELKLKSFPFAAVIPCLVLGAAFNFFTDSTLTLIPFPDSVMKYYEEIYSFLGEGSIVIELVGVVVITPIVEEAVFRGVSYTLMRRRMCRTAAIILSATLFGAAHGNLISFVFTTLLGVVLALTFEAYGSLFVPILIHASFNASSYLVTALFREPSDGTLAAVAAAAAALSAVSLALLFKIAKNKKNKKTPPSPESEEITQ